MKFVAIYVIFALSACSIKVSTPGRALVPATTVEEVFKVVVHIVSSSSEFSSMERVYYQELSDMLDWDESELPLLSDLTNDG